MQCHVHILKVEMQLSTHKYKLKQIFVSDPFILANTEVKLGLALLFLFLFCLFTCLSF